MIYKVTFKIDDENVQELENIFDKYGIDYELDEVYEEV
jgi:hypothetical protein